MAGTDSRTSAVSPPIRDFLSDRLSDIHKVQALIDGVRKMAEAGNVNEGHVLTLTDMAYDTLDEMGRAIDRRCIDEYQAMSPEERRRLDDSLSAQEGNNE
jgi:hypothetical protein